MATRLITNDEQLRRYLPNAFATVKGETPFTDRVLPWIQTAERWLFSQFVGDDFADTFLTLDEDEPVRLSAVAIGILPVGRHRAVAISGGGGRWASSTQHIVHRRTVFAGVLTYTAKLRRITYLSHVFLSEERFGVRFALPTIQSPFGSCHGGVFTLVIACGDSLPAHARRYYGAPRRNPYSRLQMVGRAMGRSRWAKYRLRRLPAGF